MKPTKSFHQKHFPKDKVLLCGLIWLLQGLPNEKLLEEMCAVLQSSLLFSFGSFSCFGSSITLLFNNTYYINSLIRYTSKKAFIECGAFSFVATFWFQKNKYENEQIISLLSVDDKKATTSLVWIRKKLLEDEHFLSFLCFNKWIRNFKASSSSTAIHCVIPRAEVVFSFHP